MALLARRSLVLAALCTVVVPVRAAGVSKADARKVRWVIEAQLAAFAADDAKRAFSFATRDIRALFGTPERFVTMVREAYPVVYRPASVAFLQPEAIDNTVIQAVEMVDEQGHVWMAVYRLERQRDRSWRISSCEIVASDAKAT